MNWNWNCRCAHFWLKATSCHSVFGSCQKTFREMPIWSIYQVRGNKLIKRSYLLQGCNRCFCYFVRPCSCCAAHRLAANWMCCLQCPGEGVCNGSVQPESGHPCLQGAPEGLPCADQGECPEEMENTWKQTREDVMNKNVVVKLTDSWIQTWGDDALLPLIHSEAEKQKFTRAFQSLAAEDAVWCDPLHYLFILHWWLVKTGML